MGVDEEERKVAITVSCSVKYLKKMKELGMSPTKVFDEGLNVKGLKDEDVV